MLKSIVALTPRAAAVVATLLLAAPLAAETLPKARGAGTVTLSGSLRTFSFTARVMPDGRVQGMGNIQNRNRENHVKFSIDCLRVQGNVASMSGEVTLSTDPTFRLGDGIWFRAIDRGEGAKEPTDEMTLVGIYLGPGPSCTVDDAFTLATQTVIEGGNIQVSPAD